MFLVFIKCQGQSNQTPSKLKIAAFKLLDQDDKPGPSMDDNGLMFIGTTKLGKIIASGKITAMTGKLIASYHNDTLYTFGQHKLKIRIDLNGTIYENGTVSFQWDNNGKLVKEGSSSGMQISPNDSQLYIDASILFLLYFTMDDVKTSVKKSR